MDNILSVSQAAVLLKISQRTLYKHLKEGKVPAFKVGKSWRLDSDSLDKWMKEQEGKKIESTSVI